MGGKESEAPARVFEEPYPVLEHEVIVARADPSDCVLYEIAELVAHPEGEGYGSCHYQRLFPSEPHKKEHYDYYVHGDPYLDVGEHLHYHIGELRMHTVYAQGDFLVEPVYFLPETVHRGLIFVEDFPQQVFELLDSLSCYR